MKYDALFTDAEQRYGLPPGVLRATALIESSGRANARSGQADGLMQFTPATAKSYGVNPFDPASAVDGAGRLWRDNLKLAGGDIDTAAKLYHAGPNRAGWGPKTDAYPVKLRAAMGVKSNPFSAMVEGDDKAPTGNNPFAAMVSGSESAPRRTPAPVSQRPANAPAPTAMGPDAGGMVAPSVPVRDWSTGDGVSSGAAGSGAGGRGLAIPANAGGVAAGSPSPVAPGQLNGGGTNSLSDILLGGAQGLQNVKQGLFGLGARGVDAVFGTDIAKRNAAQQAEGKAATGRMASSPDSPTLAAGELLGEVAGTAPLSAVAPLARIGKGGKLLSRVLTGGADMALQGGIAGGVLADPSQSLIKQIALGAALGGGLGAAAPVVGAGFAKALARAPKAAAIAAPTDDAIAGAIATGGARRGLMGNAMLPDDVRAQVNTLVQQGVPLDQAIREAQAVAIGARPHTGTVTRNPQDLAATLEGAKANTPEGLALNQQLAGNNAAAHNAIAGKVDALGGVPAHGEAMNEAAAVMAKAKDAEKESVSALYDAAEAAVPGTTVHPDALRETLASVDFQAPKTTAGKAFATGIADALKILTNPTKGGARGLGPKELERLRQSANAAYDPTGPAEVNMMVSKVKTSIDEAFDQLGNSSEAYKAARAAHKEWAGKWEVAGVEDLTRRDAAGNFVNIGEKTGVSIVRSSDPRALENIVTRLREHAPEALDKLKASIIQDAYEAVTKGAHDASGHAPLNGRRFLQELDKIGKRKLDALFTPKEQGELAAFGRGSMDLNDVQPGTFNASGTSAALLNALRDASGAANKGATGKGAAIAAALSSGGAFAGSAIGGPVGTVVGAALGGGAKYGIDALARRGGEKALARTINEIATPETARAAAAKRAQAMARAIQSAKVAGVINRGTVPAVVAAQGQR